MLRSGEKWYTEALCLTAHLRVVALVEGQLKSLLSFFLYLACILTYSHKSMKKEKDLFFPRSLYSLFISRETERERDYKNKTKKWDEHETSTNDELFCITPKLTLPRSKINIKAKITSLPPIIICMILSAFTYKIRMKGKNWLW